MVSFVKSKRAKRINISIKAPDRVRVAIPNRVSWLKAIDFANKKQDWINKTIIELSNRIKDYRELSDSEIKNGIIYLKNRIIELAEYHGFNFNKITIRNQKTRWGSCSAKNNISLNIQLVRLPEKLVDYVILHELVHTLVKNHSNKFWKTLDLYIENSKNIDKDLKKYYLI